ncbi:hypothetical protein [Rufibacter sp. LB8]|uniref:hypothetical protein n=1 Tax=Rufibacter sp. LB8 TaxID=2777781 RepID=UPI00178C2818|nr:hypothetical protein [Rufibacter sp. LB8]
MFIRDVVDIPANELSIYIPHVRDREMETYTLPEVITKYFFYPFVNGQKVDQEYIMKNFPATWDYLLSKRAILSKTKKEEKNWWFPSRTRDPKDLLQPKVIGPHLAVMPRYSLDINGAVGVSRSPYFTLKKQYTDINLLYYFLGVLNSSPCFWYISSHSHKYGSGYTMVEVKTLVKTPVPDPTTSDSNLVIKLINLVRKRINAKSSDYYEIERSIDMLVCKLYNLSDEDMKGLFGATLNV